MNTTARTLTLHDEVRPAQPEWTLFVRRLGRRRTALFGAVVVALVVITAVAAPWVSPFDPLVAAVSFTDATTAIFSVAAVLVGISVVLAGIMIVWRMVKRSRSA